MQALTMAAGAILLGLGMVAGYRIRARQAPPLQLLPPAPDPGELPPRDVDEEELDNPSPDSRPW